MGAQDSRHWPRSPGRLEGRPDRGRRDRHRIGADALRQLGHPPERRRAQPRSPRPGDRREAARESPPPTICRRRRWPGWSSGRSTAAPPAGRSGLPGPADPAPSEPVAELQRGDGGGLAGAAGPDGRSDLPAGERGRPEGVRRLYAETIRDRRGELARRAAPRAPLAVERADRRLDDEGSGYAEMSARDVDAIDAEALGREAVDKAVQSRGADPLEPGEYPVVLEQYAVGEMLIYLALHGVRGAGTPGGHQLFAGPARAAGGRSSDLDLRRRARPGRAAGAALTTRACRAARGPDREGHRRGRRLRHEDSQASQPTLNRTRAAGPEHVRAVPVAPDDGGRQHAQSRPRRRASSAASG